MKEEVNLVVRSLKSLKYQKFGGNHLGITDTQWA